MVSMRENQKQIQKRNNFSTTAVKREITDDNIHWFPQIYAIFWVQQKKPPLQNQIYNLLAELKNQDKHVTLCKVPDHMKIKCNEAIDMPGIATSRLLPCYKEC